MKSLQQEQVQQHLLNVEKPFFKVKRIIPIVEVIILSIDVALIFHSYLVLFLAGAIFATVYPFKALKTIVFAVGWGMVGFWVGHLFQSISGMTILTSLFFMTAVGIHYFGLDELFDFNE